MVTPFLEKNIAFVQTSHDYINANDNKISKLATITYKAFDNCSMPVKQKLGTSMFQGSSGALRKSFLKEVFP